MPAAERREAREQLVQDRGQRVDVDRRARRQALHDLRGQVVRRPDDLRGPGPARGVDEFGHTEVRQQRAVRAARPQRALHVQQHVLRFDVPVHDPRRVRRGQPVRDVGDDRHRRLGREAPLPVEAGAQVRAADQVHDQGEVVAVDHQVAHGDDVRMLQAEQRRPLLHEAADELLVGGEVLAQQLDGDGPLGALAQPHRAGAAPSEDLVGGVPAADLPCQDCSYRRVLSSKLRVRGACLHNGSGNRPPGVDKSAKTPGRVGPAPARPGGLPGLLGGVFKCHAHIRSDARVTAAW